VGKIILLDQHLSNMIAAGEVIERPSAMVKELIENALDAQAKHIYIQMQQGGIESLEIVDDGVGMDPEDVRLAFERHSTSKIKTKEDLFAPKSLGFRGEALPSIASVSDVILKSSHQGIGTYLHQSYGKIQTIRPTEAPDGTSLTIRGLFANTPARLKYLKSPQYEGSLIVSLVEKFALSRPDVVFNLRNEDKVLVNTTGSGQLIDALASVYGNQLARSAQTFSAQDYEMKVEVCWVHPQHHRSNNKAIHLYINQRMVRAYPLQNAIIEAFQAFIPSHRFPICVLHLSIDAQLVDVNVHPSKWEVKLSKESYITQFIREQINQNLHTHMYVGEARATSKEFQVHEQVPFFNVNQYPLQQEQMTLEVDEGFIGFPVLDVVGQLHGRYIIASTPEDVYFIDQHAAKERVNYERILSQLGQTQSEELLLPLHIETSLSFMEHFDDFKALLHSLELEIERFSSNSYLLRRIPVWMKELELSGMLQDMQDLFINQDTISEAKLRDLSLANYACHQSVRFNQHLSELEMKNIVLELSQCQQPYHCPHGRPTLIKLSARRLWSDFER
jgi:DNA mismatch repair protein MutL